MAQISYGEIQRNSNEGGTRVGFFSLKNNNDEAVVRFMHDTPDTFDIAVVHSVNIGGKFRNVNCIRSPKDPIDTCPLCAKNVKLMTRIFVHLIEYVKSENGTIVPTPKIWERPAWFADDLYNKITEYGPLSNSLFKIKRNGAAGDMKTTYSINYCVPSNYPEQFYPNVPDAFNGFSILNFHVLNKTASEMNEFLATGSFPTRGGNTGGSTPQPTADVTRDFQPAPQAPFVQHSPSDATNRNFNTTTTVNPMPPQQQSGFVPFVPDPTGSGVVVNPNPQTAQQKPWEVPLNANNQESTNRPVRYY